MTLKLVVQMLNISEEARLELNKSDSFDFNIFKLRELTSGRELESVLGFLLVKRDCMSKTNLDINKMFNFMTEI